MNKYSILQAIEMDLADTVKNWEAKPEWFREELRMKELQGYLAATVQKEKHSRLGELDLTVEQLSEHVWDRFGMESQDYLNKQFLDPTVYKKRAYDRSSGIPSSWRNAIKRTFQRALLDLERAMAVADCDFSTSSMASRSEATASQVAFLKAATYVDANYAEDLKEYEDVIATRLDELTGHYPGIKALAKLCGYTDEKGPLTVERANGKKVKLFEPSLTDLCEALGYRTRFRFMMQMLKPEVERLAEEIGEDSDQLVTLVANMIEKTRGSRLNGYVTQKRGKLPALQTDDDTTENDGD